MGITTVLHTSFIYNLKQILYKYITLRSHEKIIRTIVRFDSTRFEEVRVKQKVNRKRWLYNLGFGQDIQTSVRTILSNGDK